MELFLEKCNLEFMIADVDSLEKAIELFNSLRMSLYLDGLSPFLSPFITNFSINDYSGITVVVVEILPSGESRKSQMPLSIDNSVKVLNRLGNEGWELTTEVKTSEGTTNYTFKQPC